MSHRTLMQFSRLTAIVATLSCCSALPSGAVAQTYAERIVGGFEWPLFGVAAPGDPSRMFAGRTWHGRVDIIDLNTRTILPTPFLDISADLPNPPNPTTEQGILGMTFDPNYLTNGYVYVDYTRPDNSIEVRRFNVVGDPATSNAVDPNSGYTIINIPKGFQYWHNAGFIDFGPKDGYLYINVGDPGAPNGSQAQIITDNLHGKVLRVDVRSDAFPDDPSRNYAIPPTNPFVDKVGDDEIWAYGLRNPWRGSFDPLTGDFYINDTGEGLREEVNYQPADSPGGQNYGWARREGTVIGPPGHGVPASPEFTEPAYDYSHDDPDPLYQGTVIAGSAFYRGPVAAFEGFYLFSDFGSRNIWSLDPDAIDMRASVTNINSALTPDISIIKGVASFGKDSLGNVYMMEYDGPTEGEVWMINTHSKDAVWNGTNATAGAAGDGATWSAANNWTRDVTADSAVVDEDHVIFAPGSSQSLITLGADRVVSAVTFSAPYTLNGNALKVISGNVTVDAGVTATIESDLVAQSVNHSIRKLGAGTLLIEGDAGQIAVKEGILGGSGTLDYLTVRKDATVAPGAPAGILNVEHAFKMYSGAKLAIEVGGADNSDPQNPEFDQLVMGGSAILDGTLSVELIDLGSGMFSPANGDVFALVTAAGGITGSFDFLNLPELALGLVWQQVISENTFSLAVVAPHLPGDYNDDGTVDAGDYVVWRKTSGDVGEGLAADGTGPSGTPDGIVDQLDYDFWRAHFGNVAQAPASAAAAIPEPATLTLALLFAAIAWSRRIVRR